jgi:hypothetical protein
MKQPRPGASEAPAAAARPPQTEKSSLLAAAQGRKGDDAAPATSAQPKATQGLAATFALFVISSLGNRLFQKLQTIPMYNYPITVNIVSTAVYVPVCFAYIIPADIGVLYLKGLGVCGGFTPSTRVVSRREGGGWSLFRF